MRTSLYYNNDFSENIIMSGAIIATMFIIYLILRWALDDSDDDDSDDYDSFDDSSMIY